MASSDPDADLTDNKYDIHMETGKGNAIGPNAQVVNNYGLPQPQDSLEAYFDKMDNMKPSLLQKNLPGGRYEVVVNTARVLTLRVLPSLNKAQKRQLLLYLWESELIRKDEPIMNLARADLSEASLSGANLSEASLSGANLSEASLSGANLSEASLSGANLSGADLTDATLVGANLTDATLYNAHLSGADLTDATLYNAHLNGANLTDAHLSGADLYKADLINANLSNALQLHLFGGRLAEDLSGKNCRV